MPTALLPPHAGFQQCIAAESYPARISTPYSNEMVKMVMVGSYSMGWLDRVPDCGDLYIGGLYSLRRREAVKEAKLSHVVSVLRWPIDHDLVRPYTHLQIDVDDVDDENLLEYFPTTNDFIDNALSAGGSVLVHCAMGKSRSATVVIAYMMHKLQLSPKAALEKLRQSRGVCEPNDGFWQQLELYHSMGTPSSVEDQPAYQRWLYSRVLDTSRALHQAPDADQIRFEDEQGRGERQLEGEGRADIELKCKKCRRTLAKSQYLVSHSPQQKPTSGPNKNSNPVPPTACAHYFIDAISWMRAELSLGKLEGRFECPNPKCKTNVGKYAWQGLQCSCGDWVVPGLSLSKSKVDESGTFNASSSGIRMPPGGTSTLQTISGQKSERERHPNGQGNL